jgi:acyl transferase domain-containing protein
MRCRPTAARPSARPTVRRTRKFRARQGPLRRAREWSARHGARIYAELADDSNSLSNYQITDSHPSGDGPIQAMQQAIANAKGTLDEVDYLNAHGTST